jgi:hypothetical protein
MLCGFKRAVYNEMHSALNESGNVHVAIIPEFDLVDAELLIA